MENHQTAEVRQAREIPGGEEGRGDDQALEGEGEDGVLCDLPEAEKGTF